MRAAADPLMEKLVAACTGRGVDRIIAQNVLSSAKSALRDWRCVVSDFLTPPESAALVATLAQLPRLSAHAWGGYPDAERTAVICAHEDVAEDTAQLLQLAAPQFALLSIAGDFESGKGTVAPTTSPARAPRPCPPAHVRLAPSACSCFSRACHLPARVWQSPTAT